MFILIQNERTNKWQNDWKTALNMIDKSWWWDKSSLKSSTKLRVVLASCEFKLRFIFYFSFILGLFFANPIQRQVNTKFSINCATVNTVWRWWVEFWNIFISKKKMDLSWFHCIYYISNSICTFLFLLMQIKW